jgi:hypothetical protein
VSDYEGIREAVFDLDEGEWASYPGVTCNCARCHKRIWVSVVSVPTFNPHIYPLLCRTCRDDCEDSDIVLRSRIHVLDER